MSKILKVDSSDYRIKVQDSGNIILDTGAGGFGQVTVTGNLVVQGVTTFVQATNMSLKDNIIELNSGNTSAGVSSVLNYQSGFLIDRGSLPDAYMIFDETLTHWKYVTQGASATQNGSFVLQTVSSLGAIGTTGLKLTSISPTTGNNLTFDLQNSNATLKIANSLNNGYAARVTSDDDIPNRGFVTSYVTTAIATLSPQAIANVSGNGLTEFARVQTTTTSIDFTVASVVKAQLTPAGLSVNNINILGDTIQNTSLFNNLTLTSTNSAVDINTTLNLITRLSDIQVGVSGKLQLYSKSAEGPGRTGIYFTSNTPYGVVAYNNDELVSKNRAVLLSILL